MRRGHFFLLLLVLFVYGTDHLSQAKKKKKPVRRACGVEKQECEEHEECCYPMMCTSPGETEDGYDLPTGKASWD